MTNLSFADIESAHKRIKNFVKNTPLITIEELDKKIGAQVFFKCEDRQETKSFKVRGAFNAILSYKEKHGEFPKKIVAVSSGNHAQAVAFACHQFKIPALIYMTSIVPEVKVKATKSWGAEVILCDKRAEANRLSEEKINDGYFFIHPSANSDVIAGQGTACLEALSEIGEVDEIFAPIGGGGLIAGSYLASIGLSSNAKTFACEPKTANDAAISLKQDKIFSFPDSPKTIADGARTLALLPICFDYLKKTAGVLEISEEEILHWQKEFFDATKILIEPTSALAVAGAAESVKKNKASKILVIISGGNV